MAKGCRVHLFFCLCTAPHKDVVPARFNNPRYPQRNFLCLSPNVQKPLTIPSIPWQENFLCLFPNVQKPLPLPMLSRPESKLPPLPLLLKMNTPRLG